MKTIESRRTIGYVLIFLIIGTHLFISFFPELLDKMYVCRITTLLTLLYISIFLYTTRVKSKEKK